MRIVYVLDTIRGLGGLERIIVTKANALAEIDGNEVFILSIMKKDLPQVFEPSSKVHVINSDIINYRWNPAHSSLVNCLLSWSQKQRYRSQFQHQLSELSPDIVITCGKHDKYLYPSKRNRKWKLIREFHGEKFIEVKDAPTRFLKIVSHVTIFIDHLLNVSKCDRVIVLTNEEFERNWQGKKNVMVMPNPVGFLCDTPSSLEQKIVISAGRLDKLKNFSSLINAFKIVCGKHNDWKLRIYGDGQERQNLEQQIVDQYLQNNVFLMGLAEDMRAAMTQSSVFAFTSLSEGFGLVLIEAMECGVPVVSYQCQNGPKDIITDGVDGFLVPVGDEQVLADKICTIIENHQLHQSMGRAAKEKAKNYQLNCIIDRWMSLFNELLGRQN